MFHFFIDVFFQKKIKRHFRYFGKYVYYNKKIFQKNNITIISSIVKNKKIFFKKQKCYYFICGKISFNGFFLQFTLRQLLPSI